MSNPAYIFDALRTPRSKGKPGGSLNEVKPIELGAGLLRELQRRHDLDTSYVDDVVMGCVTPIGEQGSDVGKMIAMNADWDESVAGVQLDRFCASGLEAVNIAAQKVASGWDDLVVPVIDANGLVILEKDDFIKPNTTMEKLGFLNPSFEMMGQFGFDDVILGKYNTLDKIDHVHTPGNSSGIVDGSSAVLIGSEKAGQDLGLTPRGRVVATAVLATDPIIMLTGPGPAAQKCLKRAGMNNADIDLWEINEAFASVALRYMRDLGIDQEVTNVNGGAIAMGHPLGATGAMLVSIVLDELERRDLKRAMLSLCVGGGMGISTIIERV